MTDGWGVHPRFLIIGAMKAGTTSLFDWLGAQPDVFVPAIKEPGFFALDRAWNRGFDWYASLFEGAAPQQLSGEASVSYTDPQLSAPAASRISRSIPGVRLIFIVRDRADRLRSHYRHEVLRGRERQPLARALDDAGSRYVTRSMYFPCLRPYVDRFGSEQLHVARFEELFGPHDDGWNKVLRFLDLPSRPRPTIHRNDSAERPQFSPLLKLLWDAGIRRPPRLVPAPLRRALRPALISGRPSRLLATAKDLLPERVIDIFEADAGRLDGLLDRAASPSTADLPAGTT